MYDVIEIRKSFNSHNKPLYQLTFLRDNSKCYSRSLMNIDDLCNYVKFKHLNIDYIRVCDIEELRENYEYIKLKIS